jgi:RNA polymerase sigma-70 factor (ECF subfamily)
VHADDPPSWGQTEAIYAAHNDWLKAWLYRRLGCVDTAADLAQDTFLRLLHRPRMVQHGHHGDTRARAYLSTIANGLCIDHWRRRDIEQAWREAVAACEQPVQASEEHHLLVIDALLAFDAMLRQLPTRVADVFIMSQVEGWTYREIAQRLAVSDRTVKRDMAQAMLHCAVYLEKGSE